ncbi:MAG: hypothetical protein K0U59_12110 [Gammaproteobacteria bacterium]|nr:hypothetical protein [Gammaproteobacteria bacterium]
MKLIKKNLAAIMLLSLFSASSYALNTCKTGVVDSIFIGVDDDDDGNAVGFSFEDSNKVWKLDVKRNLNDPSGYALLSALMYSKSSGYSVSIYSHNCNYSDRIRQVSIQEF